MSRRRGVGVVELVLALAVFVVAAIFVFSVFGKSARHAVQSRNRKLALMTAQSYLEEIRGHEYGRPAPSTWPLGEPITVDYPFYVNGKEVLAEFKVSLKLETESLVGKSDKDFDRATLTVHWDEGLSGNEQARQLQQKQHTITASLLVAKPMFNLAGSP